MASTNPVNDDEGSYQTTIQTITIVDGGRRQEDLRTATNSGVSGAEMQRELEVDVPITTEGSGRSSGKRSCSAANITTSKAVKILKQDASFVCGRCGNRYVLRRAFDEHANKCSYEIVNGSSVQRAVNLAHAMIYLDKTVECYGRHDCNPNMEGIEVDLNCDQRVLQKGWGRKPKWGEALADDNDVEEFRDKIVQWFNVGSACPSQKISAARMFNMLEGLNPHRYDLPSEQKINALITSLCKQEKEARKAAALRRLEEKKAKKLEAEATKRREVEAKRILEEKANNTAEAGAE